MDFDQMRERLRAYKGLRAGDRVQSQQGMHGVVTKTRFDCAMPYIVVRWDNGAVGRHGAHSGIGKEL
jgi:preprotein translocase subunit YajC